MLFSTRNKIEKYLNNYANAQTDADSPEADIPEHVVMSRIHDLSPDLWGRTDDAIYLYDSWGMGFKLPYDFGAWMAIYCIQKESEHGETEAS